MAPSKKTSRPSAHDSPPSPKTVRNPFSGQPTLFSHNSKTNMSSLRPPKMMTFPTPLPPPHNLPLRECVQNFAELDAVYNKTEHPILGSQGIGRGGYDKDRDESSNRDAVKILEQSITDRMPFINLASDRLQAACSVRNQAPFDLPELPKRPQILPNEGLGINFSRPRSPDNGGALSKLAAQGSAGNARVDSGVGFIPKIPVGMHVVDKATGKGLREFMLQKGKECGMRKRECKSITFHDFNPPMATGLPSNVLLGHYGVEKGERIDVYEVDLPATQTDDGSGEEYASTETWIWILMSRPMVSYDPNDKVTIPSNPPNSYAKYLDKLKAEPTLKTTPPNFPKPIPSSWIVFAAPKAHITDYPEATEDLEQQPSHYPFVSKSKKIQKRIDYDFSFSGIPIFEFSSSDNFTDDSKKPQFLSIEQQGAWSTNDPYEAYKPDEYNRIYNMWEAGEWGVRESFMASATNQGLDENNRPKATMPAPNRGLWWSVFYQRMYEDVTRWEKIRRAMGLGMCRVVVRWDEYPDEGDVDMTGLVAVGGKKAAKRVTRSETKRRSGLGPGEGSANREPEKDKKVKKR